uniref:Uncharacterized protein n=1 Tax=Poecilia mexicana TaxID=48701 RepID=A0A3B3WKQ8_9TELE
MWTLRWLLLLKHFPQVAQEYGRSPVWLRVWRSSVVLWLKQKGLTFHNLSICLSSPGTLSSTTILRLLLSLKNRSRDITSLMAGIPKAFDQTIRVFG